MADIKTLISKGAIEKAFYEKVKKVGKCWEWQAGRCGSGYGAHRIDGKQYMAHRLSYMLAKGEIAKGLFVLHKCDNRKCVNPAHLFLGTAKDNSKDMIAKGRAYFNYKPKESEKCINGHLYSEGGNKRNSRGGRFCGICRNESSKRTYQKKKAIKQFSLPL